MIQPVLRDKSPKEKGTVHWRRWLTAVGRLIHPRRIWRYHRLWPPHRRRQSQISSKPEFQVARSQSGYLDIVWASVQHRRVNATTTFLEMFRKECHSLPAARERPVSPILPPATNNQAQRNSVQCQDTRSRTRRPRINSFWCGGRRNSGTFNQEGSRGSAMSPATCPSTSVIPARYDGSLLGIGIWLCLTTLPPRGRRCTAAVNPSPAWTVDRW